MGLYRNGIAVKHRLGHYDRKMNAGQSGQVEGLELNKGNFKLISL